MKYRSLLAKLGIALVAASMPVIVAGCALLPKEEIDEPPALKAPPKTRTVIYQVKRDTVASEIRGLGRAASTMEKSLYFRISGRLKKVYVDYGTEVSAGSPLMELETGDLKFNLHMAKLDYDQALLRLKKAQLTLGLDGGTNKFDYKSMQLDAEKTKARVDDLNAKMEASVLRAPFAGRVVEIKAKEGDQISDYTTMITVADPNKVEVQVEVDQNELSEMTPGMKAKVSITQEEWVVGKVRQVATSGSELSPGVPDRRCMIKLTPEDTARLVYNDPYQVTIVKQEAVNVLTLPNSAIRDYMGRKFVRIIDGDSRREADVEVGIEGSTLSEITKGVKEGEKVQGR